MADGTRTRLEGLLCDLAPGELTDEQEEAEAEILDLFDDLSEDAYKARILGSALNLLSSLRGCSADDMIDDIADSLSMKIDCGGRSTDELLDEIERSARRRGVSAG